MSEGPKGRRLPVVRETAETMQTVGVRELRQNLSVYLDRVKSGEALTVTEHGQAVALLRPLPPVNDVLARLVAEGHARPALRLPSELPRPLEVKLEKSLSEILQEMRDEDPF